MSQSDGPSSAAATGLRSPSAEAAELEARAADAAVEAEETAKKQREDDEAAAKKKVADRAAAVADEARAPTSFWHSLRFFSLVLAGVLVSAFFVAELTDGEEIGRARIFFEVFGAVWVLCFLAIVVDGATWRRRLPFALEGFDHIAGGQTFGQHDAPWVAFKIRIVLKDRSREARAARKHAAEILVARVNKIMTKDKDDKKDMTPQRMWRNNEGKGKKDDDDDVIRGEANRGLYTTRVIEKWLRSDVRLLAKAYGVEKVVVDARFTGATSWISD